ncbi:MAG: hypothetical protein K2H72_01385 [Muribaculaceae bacterium]|nr:hypothetical protein [Muribaculaceae bacterium]
MKMKTVVFRLLSLLAVLAPAAAASQTNIKSAFDAIIKCPKAEITESHVLNKDRNTNLKSGQDDIYYFILPADRMDLVKKVLSAFDNDLASAYVVKKGKNTGKQSNIQLYSGESSTGFNAVISIDDPGCEYIYELFAPSKSEDPDGIHRYAYGFNYKEEDGKIIGKMVINYATTSEYRQQAQRESQMILLADMNKANRGSSDVETQQTWFDMVMACVSGIEEANQKTRIALATKAYRLVRDVKSYPEATPQDKKTMAKIFRMMLNKPICAADPILVELLQQCESTLTGK